MTAWVANRYPALQTIADVSSGGLEVVNVGDDTARLFDEDPAVFCRLGAPGGALEKLDPEPVF